MIIRPSFTVDGTHYVNKIFISKKEIKQAEKLSHKFGGKVLVNITLKINESSKVTR